MRPMKQARLYETPDEFADMMINHLTESTNMKVRKTDEEPLLLKVAEGGQDVAQISLHTTFQTYMNTGDLNFAINFLNGIIRSSQDHTNYEDFAKIDPICIYPALRDKRYVEEAAREMDLITEKCINGLYVVYLEDKEGYSKLINQDMLKFNPELTADRIKFAAYYNLRAEGWTKPRLKLPSPLLKSCTVEVFLDNPFPLECQFMVPEMAKRRVPDNYLIAFTNRETTLLMRSTEDMSDPEKAMELAKKSRFTDVVRRSHLVMPHPVSDQIYWVNKGEFHPV